MLNNIAALRNFSLAFGLTSLNNEEFGAKNVKYVMDMGHKHI
jgi:hypothetical protein